MKTAPPKTRWWRKHRHPKEKEKARLKGGEVGATIPQEEEESSTTQKVQGAPSLFPTLTSRQCCLEFAHFSILLHLENPYFSILVHLETAQFSLLVHLETSHTQTDRDDKCNYIWNYKFTLLVML